MWHWLELGDTAEPASRNSRCNKPRCTPAGSVAKAHIYAALWPLFLQSVQTGLQSGRLSNDVSILSASSNPIDLSYRFAEPMGAMSQELSGPIFSEDEREPTQEHDALVAWIRILHADPMEIGRRLALHSPDRAIRWFSGIEMIEADLSLAHVRKVFFVREGPAAFN